MAVTVTINLENLSESESKQLCALINKANNISNVAWTPQIGETYWFLCSDGSVSWEPQCTNSVRDTMRFAIGNCFRTETEVVFAKERFKVLHELSQFASKKNGANASYRLYYDAYSNKVLVKISEAITETLRFETREDIYAAINTVGEDRIKKYYFGM